MVIVEILNTTDGQPRYERIDKQQVSIGRAPDNDIILLDPYVDGHHLRLDITDPDAWTISDLATTNGTRRGKEPVQVAQFAPGDQFRIGKTFIRIYDRNFQVAEALSLGDLEHRLLDFNSLGITIGLSLFMIVTGLASVFLSFSGGDIKPVTYIRGVTDLLITPVLFAMAAALLARILRGESRFRPIYNLSLAFAAFAVYVDLVLGVLNYNLPGTTGKGFLTFSINVIMVVVYFWAIMLLTTRLKTVWRNLLTLLFVLGIYGSHFITYYSHRDAFRPFPSYDARLYAPDWLFRSGITPADYQGSLPELFDEADEAAAEDSENEQ
ncbi:MAG: FHA domain-containing protein [Pseudomonadales bacterium]|nr:FHA domain-containing protein [Pseudomonadales bacterium]